MNIIVIAVASVVISVMAQFALKAGMSAPSVKACLSAPFGVHTFTGVFLQPYVVLGFVLYGLGAVVWLKVLAQWDVSKAYPFVGLGFILSMIIGSLLGEQVGSMRVAGALLICLGVLLISRT